MKSSTTLSKKWFGGLLVAALGLCSISAAHGQSLIDIGGLGFQYSEATAINNSGQVAGVVYNSSG